MCIFQSAKKQQEYRLHGDCFIIFRRFSCDFGPKKKKRTSTGFMFPHKKYIRTLFFRLFMRKKKLIGKRYIHECEFVCAYVVICVWLLHYVILNYIYNILCGNIPSNKIHPPTHRHIYLCTFTYRHKCVTKVTRKLPMKIALRKMIFYLWNFT